jgi:IclR family pca regulon transcriptional regulator
MDDQVRREEDGPRIKPNADPRLSRSMEFGLTILECFSEDRSALGIADLAKIVGLSRATTHRYAATLLVLGYLEQDSRRKYRLARRAGAPGAAVLGAVRLPDGAPAILEDLREQTGHTVSIGLLDGQRALYIRRLLGHRKGQYEVDRHMGIGVAQPLHCTAIGKALLAALPKQEAARLVRELELARHGPHTITGKRALHAELDRVRGEGWALSDEEHLSGARSIAAPVQCEQIEQLLAIEVAVPAAAYTVQELIAGILPALQWAAGLISSG